MYETFTMMSPFLVSTSKLTFWIKFHDFESKNGVLAWILSSAGLSIFLTSAIGDNVSKPSISSAIFMSMSYPSSWAAQNGVTPPLTAIPTIPSGTGTPNIFLPSSETAITPPIPIFSNLFMMFRARSRPTLGMRRKLAGIVPFPVFITSNTEVIPGATNASRGVTDVFL